MAEPLIDLAADLQRRGEPFVLATVVRCEAPTSAKPGAKALVHADGRVEGWVGGACAEPVLVRESLKALRDGRPRLIGLYGEGAREPGRTEGILDYAMTCHSGGTLEIYVEPYLPTPQLVLVGHGPVIEALETLGRAAGYSLVALADAAAWSRLDALALRRRLRESRRQPQADHGDSRSVESARRGRRPSRSTEGAGRTRPRRRHAGRDRQQHPGRDRPAPPQRQDRRGRADG